MLGASVCMHLQVQHVGAGRAVPQHGLSEILLLNTKIYPCSEYNQVYVGQKGRTLEECVSKLKQVMKQGDVKNGIIVHPERVCFRL